MPDEFFGIAFAAMIGMSTDSAHLGIAIEGEAFAGHGDELSLGAHTEVGAHLAGSAAEEARESDVCEGDHFGGVFVGERKNFGSWWGRLNLVGQHHLEDLEGLFEDELGWMGIAFANEPHKFAGGEEGVELQQSGFGW